MTESTETPFMLGVDFSDHARRMVGLTPFANIVGLSANADILFSKKIEADNIGELYKKTLAMAMYYGCQISIESNSTSFIHYVIEAGQSRHLYESGDSRNAGFYVNAKFGGDMTMPALLAYMALSKTLAKNSENEES